VLATGAWAGEAPATNEQAKAEFAGKPAVAKDGDKWVITFAAKAACDATVAVVDKDGNVVRHLVSGMLGKTAPEPFAKDSLAQKLEWDGNDDAGKPAPRGCRVRVSLGMKPEFVRMLYQKEQGLDARGPLGLAVDKDGLLYIKEGDTYIRDNGLAGALQKLNIKVFDGDGAYVRTLSPFRGDWPPEKVSEVRWLTTTDGRTIPLALSGGNFSYGGFLPGAPGTTRSAPVITSDGRMFYPCGKPVHGKRRLLVMGTDGTATKETFAGPPLQADAKMCAYIFMALSPDEKYLYFAGARTKKKGLGHAVYRTTLDAQDFAKPFIGKPFTPGDEQGQFNDPRGLAVDPKGRIWVCDYDNDRIQVFSAEGAFLRKFELPGPEQVRVHPATGAVYVLSILDRGATHSYGKQVTWEIYKEKALVKFASFDDWKEVARLELPKQPRYMHDAGPMMVLDATRDDPVIWLAVPAKGADKNFMHKVIDRHKVVDKDGTLQEVPHKMTTYKRRGGGPPPMGGDPAHNRLVVGGGLLDPVTGEVTKLNLEGEAGKAALAMLSDIAVGPKGLIYYRSGISLKNVEKIWRIRRFDRDGKLVPFEKAGEYLECNANRAHTAFNFQSSTFDVGPDGRIYVVSAASRENRDVFVDVYGPDGALVQPKLVAMTKSGGCFRIDGAGRMYAADTIRSKKLTMPPMYDADPFGDLARWYGTVFRYGSEGGGKFASNPLEATHIAGGMAMPKFEQVIMKGTLWEFHGIAPMPLKTGCQCVTAHVRFDTDDWGRVWVPDAPGFCVAGLDAAGNLITRFGAYGSLDNTGAGGTVPEPAIPLWYPNRTAALDGDVFVNDMLAGRIVQVRLTYTAEESAQIE